MYNSIYSYVQIYFTILLNNGSISWHELIHHLKMAVFLYPKYSQIAENKVLLWNIVLHFFSLKYWFSLDKIKCYATLQPHC